MTLGPLMVDIPGYELDSEDRDPDRLRLGRRRALQEVLVRPAEGRNDRTDLAGLVRSAIYVLRSEARRRGIEIEAHGLDESGSVPGSPATWQVAVFNLILNAVRHAPAGSTVVVSARAASSRDVNLTSIAATIRLAISRWSPSTSLRPRS